MDDETRRLVTTFREFMTEVVNQVRAESGDVQPLLPVLEEHLGVPPRSVPVVVEQVSPLRFADADVELEALAPRNGGRRLIGVGGGMTRRHASLAEIIENAGLHGMFPVGPVDYACVSTGPDTASRRRLNRLYARDLPFSAAALDETAERAEGTTASFTKELMRRAVLGAADAGHPPDDADLSAALDEMLSDTQALSRSLFGGAADGPGGVPGGFGAGGPQPGLAPPGLQGGGLYGPP